MQCTLHVLEGEGEEIWRGGEAGRLGILVGGSSYGTLQTVQFVVLFNISILRYKFKFYEVYEITEYKK